MLFGERRFRDLEQFPFAGRLRSPCVRANRKMSGPEGEYYLERIVA